MDFTDNLNVDPRFVGLESLLNPFVANTSSQRGAMLSSNVTQALITNGCEPPLIMTGFENIIGSYEFNNTKRSQDIEVLAIIPKFKINIGSHQVKSNPALTIVYVGLDDHIVSYFELETYTKLSDHFGYMNTWLPNIHNLNVNSYIPKDMQFVTSPAHKGEHYCLGINANVANLTIPEVTEDAFVISRSFADKMSHHAIDSIHLSISKDQVPLNLYGAEDDFKFIPDIGECVNEEGILLTLRKIDNDSFITNMTEEALSHIEYLHDDIYTAPPGATITDIQVYTSRAAKSIKNTNNVYSQAMKYQEQHYDYYKTTLSVYKTVKELGYKISDKFNTLVTRCLGMYPSKGNKIKLMNKREMVEFIDIEITWSYERKVGRGFKLTGRFGDKGVVSDIWEDENMPIDPLGFKADIIKSPESVANRMNIGQFYEEFFNRTSEIIHQRLVTNQLGDDNSALEYILGYINKINPNQVIIMRDVITEMGTAAAIQKIRDEGIYLIIPPFLNTICEKLVLEISEIYDIQEYPVKFNKQLKDGTLQQVITDEPVLIGKEYIYLLGKIPKYQMSAVEMGFVSQFQIPHKLSSKDTKNQYPFGQTTIRLGEDETSLLSMSLGSETTARFMSLNANSPIAVEELQRELLTSKYPSKLKHINMATQDMLDNNNVINLFNHQLGVCGIQAGIKK